MIVDQFGNQLDIVLGQLSAAGLAHALKRFCARVGRAVMGCGLRLGVKIVLCHQFSVAQGGLTSKVAPLIVSNV